MGERTFAPGAFSQAGRAVLEGGGGRAGGAVSSGFLGLLV